MGGIYLGFVILSSCSLIILANNVFCGQRTDRVVHLEEGDSFKFETQRDGETFYKDNTECRVVYKRGKTCRTLKYSCSQMAIRGKSGGKGSGEKCLRDYMRVRIYGVNTRYCRGMKPNLTSRGGIAVFFKSDKELVSTGAKCTIECIERNTASTSATSTTIRTTTTPGDILMQRRVRGGPATFFAKTFSEYQSGFNSSEGESWLGLDELHRITSSASYSLVVTLTDWDDKRYTAVYDTFKVGAGDEYRIEVGGFNEGMSTLGDSITASDYNNLNGQKFSAMDRDQDSSSGDCSVWFYGNGGWWYNDCSTSNPNGENSATPQGNYEYISWKYGGERGNSMNNFASSELLLRPNY